jgi:hypothetical protein
LITVFAEDEIKTRRVSGRLACKANRLCFNEEEQDIKSDPLAGVAFLSRIY